MSSERPYPCQAKVWEYGDLREMLRGLGWIVFVDVTDEDHGDRILIVRREGNYAILLTWIGDCLTCGIRNRACGPAGMHGIESRLAVVNMQGGDDGEDKPGDH